MDGRRNASMYFAIDTGVLATGGGATAPLTFAEISPKLPQNKGFYLKFLFFAPHFWSCLPTCRQVPTPLGIHRYKMGREKLALSPFLNTFESPKKVYETLE